VAGIERYVGGHPMAGSERSGPLAASASLFDGRPWAVVPHATSDRAATAAVAELARLAGASVVRLSPEEHDLAVARTSHLPHLLAVLMAGRLADAPAAHLALSGQGVRDVTRIAAGDPALWEQIVTGNAPAVAGLLTQVRDQLDVLIDAVSVGDRGPLGEILERGVAGTLAIPGKHGGPSRPTASVFVSLPDHPGELARLFAHVGDSAVNIEDVHIDHDPGRDTGLVELVVEQARADHLQASLESRGWETHR
jgi:prephenate dehydrogenase